MALATAFNGPTVMRPTCAGRAAAPVLLLVYYVHRVGTDKFSRKGKALWVYQQVISSDIISFMNVQLDFFHVFLTYPLHLRFRSQSARCDCCNILTSHRDQLEVIMCHRLDISLLNL